MTPLKVGIAALGFRDGSEAEDRYLINLLIEFSQQAPEVAWEVVTRPHQRRMLLGEAPGITALEQDPGDGFREWFWFLKTLPRLARQRGWGAMLLPTGQRHLPWPSAVPGVAVVHHLDPVAGAEPWAGLYRRLIWPRLLRRQDQVITGGQECARELGRLVPSERVSVVPPAVDGATFFPRDRDQSLARVCHLPEGPDGPYVLYPAPLGPAHLNHRRLLQAFAACKAQTGLHHQLLLAGPTLRGGRDILQMAQTSPVARDIVFLGDCPPAELPHCLAGADLVVWPSLEEGFALPVLEAMASGTPVVCSQTPALTEVVGKAALTCDPLNPEEMALCLTAVLSDAPLAAQMRQKGLRRAAQFSWERTASQVLKLIRRAAEAR